jgi:hypothetical protein
MIGSFYEQDLEALTSNFNGAHCFDTGLFGFAPGGQRLGS